ncbi:xanthine dehydrogenase family protein molybdopterin-binding subunit [Streptomyces sp. NBC_01197]|uniref:xanthine dehydrogenase family protein molybdopterin-binding subunit n=1 Tax=Streptomyces sp. NBC_01197 TaxID=2903768 RepID=UPI002E127BD8|nr:xanthine dehydrogenase family protein molybdopterin-binding subunit [Streptomyces sp. NBC_01197]
MSTVVGRDDPRRDALAKVTGRARYGYDVSVAGMLHAMVLRSPHAHARVVSIDATKAEKLEGVHAVLTRGHLDGLDPMCGAYVRDQPFVALDTVRYVGEVVAAVAAEDEHIALAALDLIDVEYEKLPDASSVLDARGDDAPELFPTPPQAFIPRYGPGASAAVRTARNVSFEYRYTTGPIDVWHECDHVFTDTFTFSRMQHMHLEPFVSVAVAPADRVEVWTSTQEPFQLRQELARIFKVPENTVQVHVEMLGGGFGAKTNCRTEPIAIRLSQLSGGRPVRYCLTTEEAFLTVSQHEAILTLTTGLAADGTFLARKSEVLLNAGAYSDYSPLVAEKAGYRMPGAYRWRHIDTACQTVMTNTVPAGAFRGFGGTQATWANERQLDLIAARLGMDPLKLRLKNVLDLGERSVPGETPLDSDFSLGLGLIADAIGYHERSLVANRGMGIALACKDGGGMNKLSEARVNIDTAGNVCLQSALVEMGQGGHSALIQIVADVLRTDPSKVKYVSVDTDHSPYDSGTHSSSGIAVMGRAVQQAAEQARHTVLDFAAKELGISPQELELRNWEVVAKGQVYSLTPLTRRVFGGRSYEFTGDGHYKPDSSAESAFETPCAFWEVAWAAAEVTVDPETGRVELLKLVISGDAGKVINALGARGQDEGAAVMGIGQALFEELRYEGSELLNGEALNYRLPMADDLPRSFVSITQEQGHGSGPFGSKGLGEGGMLPVPPAIAAAIADAVGAQITSLPMSPERVLTAIEAVHEHDCEP